MKFPVLQFFCFFEIGLLSSGMLQTIRDLIPVKLKIYLLYKKIRLWGLFDTGNKVECNLCGSHFSRFANFRGRKGVLCPYCFSLDLHRSQYAFLLAQISSFEGAPRVCVVEAENCFHKRFMETKEVRYNAANLRFPTPSVLRVQIGYQIDLARIEVPDHFFEVFICNHVLEYVPDDAPALQEIHRVLKPGGFGLLQVQFTAASEKDPEKDLIDPGKRKRVRFLPGPVREYSKEEYLKKLEEVGFEVEIFSCAQELKQKRWGLLLAEDLIIARKKQVGPPSDQPG